MGLRTPRNIDEGKLLFSLLVERVIFLAKNPQFVDLESSRYSEDKAALEKWGGRKLPAPLTGTLAETLAAFKVTPGMAPDLLSRREDIWRDFLKTQRYSFPRWLRQTFGALPAFFSALFDFKIEAILIYVVYVVCAFLPPAMGNLTPTVTTFLLCLWFAWRLAKNKNHSLNRHGRAVLLTITVTCMAYGVVVVYRNDTPVALHHEPTTPVVTLTDAEPDSPFGTIDGNHRMLVFKLTNLPPGAVILGGVLTFTPKRSAQDPKKSGEVHSISLKPSGPQSVNYGDSITYTVETEDRFWATGTYLARFDMGEAKPVKYAFSVFNRRTSRNLVEPSPSTTGTAGYKDDGDVEEGRNGAPVRLNGEGKVARFEVPTTFARPRVGSVWLFAGFGGLAKSSQDYVEINLPFEVVLRVTRKGRRLVLNALQMGQQLTGVSGRYWEYESDYVENEIHKWCLSYDGNSFKLFLWDQSLSPAGEPCRMTEKWSSARSSTISFACHDSTCLVEEIIESTYNGSNNSDSEKMMK